MPTEKKDRNTIVSRALGIEPEKERAAYIAEACGGDDEERRQVEERVAEHFQSGNAKAPIRTTESGTPSPEQGGATPADDREEIWTLARRHRRMVATAAGMLLFLLAAAVAGIGLGIWEWRKAEEARQAEHKADEKCDKAEEDEKKLKSKLQESEEVRQIREKERDRARKAENAARNAEIETKGILDFFKKTLVSAARPADVSLTRAFWAGSQGNDLTVRKNITLRTAVDETASKVAETFADLPMAEASVREMLGLAYSNLGAGAQAVQQYKRAYDLRMALQGVHNPDTARCRNQLAIAYRLDGRTMEADRLFGQTPNSSEQASALAVHGSMLLLEKKPAEAELKLRESLTIRESVQPDYWTTFETKSLLGEALLDQKKYAEAEPLLLSGYQGMKKHESKIPAREKVRLTKTLERLVHLYEAWGKPDKAANWRKELDKTEPAKSP